jgi:tetratricopeptide (TPR) repeat protein
VDGDRAARQLVAKTLRALETEAYVDVIRLGRQVSDELPEAAEVRVWEGAALWHLDRWQAAEDAWTRALRLNPEVPEAGWRLLHIFYYEHRFAEAEALALKLYPIEPDAADRTQLLVELIRQDNERVGPEATAMTLEPVLASEPENFHASRALGLSYVQLGRHGDGSELLQQARRLRPNDLEGWFAWIWYLFETGQVAKLGEAWEQLPATALEHARFLRYRGMWAEAIDDAEEAERAYRATIERDPGDRKAHYQLARLLRGRGDDEAAVRHETEARELDTAREALAAAYIRAKQSDFKLSADDCREFARLCDRLARKRQAEFWEQEASRRGATRT